MGDKLWDDDLDFGDEGEGGGKPVITRGRPKTALEELEDKYQRVKDENLQLKKHSNEQEDKIKRLATKLIRITQDIKKRESEDQGPSGGPRRRDVETEEFIEDLKAQVRELTKQNEKLKNQVTYLKHVIDTLSAKKPSPYDNVQSRVNTGLTKKLVPLIGGRLGGKKPAARKPPAATEPTTPPPPSPSPPPQPTMVFLEPSELLAMLQASAANFDWSQVELASLQRFGQYIALRTTELENEVANTKEEYRRFSAQLQETRHQLALAQERFKSTEDTFNTSMRAEHADVEQLRAELREKSASLAILQTNQHYLDTNHSAVKDSHGKLVEQTEMMNKALREERKRAIQLESELNASQLSAASVKELNMIIEDLRRDKRVLQDEHNRLLQTVFGEGQNKELQFERERSLYKAKIQQLEQQMTTFINENQKLVDQTRQTLQRLEVYKTESDQLRTDKKNIEIQFYEAQQKNELFQQKLKFFSGDSMADLKELEQALIYIKNKKMGLAPTPDETKMKRELEELKLHNLELAHDIEKTQKLLSLQENIKSEYKHMVDTHRKEVDAMRKDYEVQLSDQARLLDIKSDKIRKLEFQLNGVLYRKPVQDIETKLAELDQDLTDLGQGENAIEISFLGLLLNGSHVPHDVDTFLSFDFYEHETIVTPVFTANVSPDFVARMVIRVDDFLLHYLKTQNMPVELYRAYGFDFALLGCCMIPFRDLLARNEKISNSKEIISTDDHITAIGTLQYSVRMVRSITEEVKLWKGRSLAMSLALDEDVTGGDGARNNTYNGNELIIKIVECTLVFPPGKSNNAIPSPYVYHQFFEFPEQDTPIVDNSFNPSFNSTHTYPLQITTELDEHLLTGNAEFYVFDDKDDNGDFCFGIATVSLKSLVRDKPVEGTYPIVDHNGNQNGTIQVEIYWRMPYKRPAIHGLPPRSVKAPGGRESSPQLESDKVEQDYSRPDRSKFRSDSLTRQQENDERAKRLGELAMKYHNHQSGGNVAQQNYESPKPGAKPRRTQRSASAVPEQPEPLVKASPRLQGVSEILTDDEPMPRTRSINRTRSSGSNPTTTPRNTSQPNTPRLQQSQSQPSPQPLQPLQPITQPQTPQPSQPPLPVLSKSQSQRTERSQPPSRPNSTTNSNNNNDNTPENTPVVTKPKQSLSRSASKNSVIPYNNNEKPSNPQNCFYVSIRKVDMHPNVLSDPEVEKIFASFEFLRSDENFETEALSKENNPFIFNYSREFQASDFQYKIHSILSSNRKSDADVMFDVCNEKSGGECVLLGTAEINLLDLLAFGKNLENQAVDVLDEDDNSITFKLPSFTFSLI